MARAGAILVSGRSAQNPDWARLLEVLSLSASGSTTRATKHSPDERAAERTRAGISMIVMIVPPPSLHGGDSAGTKFEQMICRVKP